MPTLRLGFSSFVNPILLTMFRQCYSDLFPKCELVFSGGDSTLILQRLESNALDCGILPCPIDSKTLDVIPVAHSRLVVCMRTDDPLALQTHLDIHEVAPRIRVFRDPELHPSAHAHLVNLFAEVGIRISLANSVMNPANIQWMVKVKENYGLALIDRSSVTSGILFDDPADCGCELVGSDGLCCHQEEPTHCPPICSETPETRRSYCSAETTPRSTPLTEAVETSRNSLLL